jgi:hypothetical protein
MEELGKLLHARDIPFDGCDRKIMCFAHVQWVKKLSQCLDVLERLTWHKSNKLCNNLKIIYVILGYLSFHISLNARDLK